MESKGGLDGLEMYARGAGGVSDHGTQPQDRETLEAVAAAAAYNAAADGSGSCPKNVGLSAMNFDDDWKRALRKELGVARYVRPYATSDTFDAPSPDLFVKGIGSLSMPLSELHAAQIKEKIRREEGHREAESAADNPVNARNVWFVSEDHLKLRNPDWQPSMMTLCRQVASRLGLGGGGNSSVLASKLGGMLVGEKGSLLKFDAEFVSQPEFLVTGSDKNKQNREVGTSIC